MTKHFCDRCGKECEKLVGVKIPDKRGVSDTGSYYREGRSMFCAKDVELCSDCEEAANDIYKKLVDIRFALFDGFVKGYEKNDTTE